MKLDKLIFILIFLVVFLITLQLSDLYLVYTICCFLVLSVFTIFKDLTRNNVQWNSFLVKALYYIIVSMAVVSTYTILIASTEFGLKDIMVKEYLYVNPDKLQIKKISTDRDYIGLVNKTTNEQWYNVDKDDLNRFEKCTDKTINLIYVKTYDVLFNKRFYKDGYLTSYDTLQVMCK